MEYQETLELEQLRVRLVIAKYKAREREEYQLANILDRLQSQVDDSITKTQEWIESERIRTS